MAVEIRPIGPDHIEGFHQALDIVARERRFLSFLEGPPVETSKAFVLDNIKRGHPQFVALSEDNQVVGWCDVTPKPRPIYAHGGVLGMGLLPQYRGQGIGTRLIQAALAASGKAGLHRVELTVREQNTPAIRLYEKVGFAVEGLHRDAVRIDGVYENIVCMAILLEQ